MAESSRGTQICELILTCSLVGIFQKARERIYSRSPPCKKESDGSTGMYDSALFNEKNEGTEQLTLEGNNMDGEKEEMVC